MRIFDNLEEAAGEIQRDVYKGSRVAFTRVQQRVGVDVPGRERIGYNYGITGHPASFPVAPVTLVDLGQRLDIRMYKEHPSEILVWLKAELDHRLYPEDNLGLSPTEILHPALETTYEGSHPSYTYTELLQGAMNSIVATLKASPDSRRAYWPIFREHHAQRAAMPTRVPCSIGYHAMIRTIPGLGERLVFTYLQRSADFDTFWLSDVWLARKFQEGIAKKMGIEPGLFMHHVISFHSFEIEGIEVY